MVFIKPAAGCCTLVAATTGDILIADKGEFSSFLG